MSRATYLRLLLGCFVSALILSAVSVLFLNRIADSVGARHRDRFFVFMAEMVERKIAGQSVDDIAASKDLFRPDWFGGGDGDKSRPHEPMMPPPPPPNGFFNTPGRMFPPPPPSGDRRGPPGPDLWIVGEDGHVLATNSEMSFPIEWATAAKPTEAHGIESKEDFFRLFPSISVIRLDRQPATFLVAYDNRKQALFTLFGVQAVFTFSTVLIALLLSTSFIFIYLRRKSEEARRVLLRLEQGDLKARFPLKKFDESGGLLVDFNRMAGEIEKLVNRVHATESTRKELLQELGHDLKTPLTSLNTSFETLKAHHQKMSETDRRDVFEMVDADVKYMRELLDQLMTISALDEPNYKSSTEMVDLGAMLGDEIRGRAGVNGKEWVLDPASLPSARLTGDSHLIRRLLKNALDNAGRFAGKKITARVAVAGPYYALTIADDGPGLNETDLASYGQRRGQRRKREGTGLHFSLGLGSVIMKSIAELHGGGLRIENTNPGACVTILLPKAP